MRKIGSILSWAAVALLALFAAVILIPHLLGMGTYAVTSGSMAPAIPTGSLVFTKPEAVYAAGDVVTYQADGGMIVTHRIVALNTAGNTATTKGDANNAADMMPISQGQILGKVVMHLPLLGTVSEALKSLPGRLAAAAVLILLLISVLIPKKKGQAQ